MMRVCPGCRGTGKLKQGMEPSELKIIRAALGLRAGLRRALHQATFAQLLGITERTLRNYLTGVRPILYLVAQEARRLKDQQV